MFLSNFTGLTLSQGYRRLFKVVPALTAELPAESYRIRHQVYCREIGNEPLRAEGLEADAYNEQSGHSLMQSVLKAQSVGCARLALVEPDAPRPAHLPFEISCEKTLDPSIVDPRTVDHSRSAEVSRLAVVGSHRRRQGGQKTPTALSEEDFGTPSRPRQPHLALAVYLCLISLARHYAITALLVLTERPLATNLARLGVRVEQIGGEIERRGIRIPSMMSGDEIIGGMNFVIRALFEVVSRAVQEGLEAAGEQAVRAKHHPFCQ